MPRFYSPREELGISYASLERWIYRGKLKSVRTLAAIIEFPNLKSMVYYRTKPSWVRLR